QFDIAGVHQDLETAVLCFAEVVEDVVVTGDGRQVPSQDQSVGMGAVSIDATRDTALEEREINAQVEACGAFPVQVGIAQVAGGHACGALACKRIAYASIGGDGLVYADALVARFSVRASQLEIADLVEPFHKRFLGDVPAEGYRRKHTVLVGGGA